MSDPVTANFAWSYPVVNADAATWGTTLNATIIAIDAQMALMATKASPTFTGAASFVSGAFSSTLTVSGVLTGSGGVVGALTGNVTGNLTGNVTGNVTGNLTGNVAGNVSGSSGSCTGNAATASSASTATTATTATNQSGGTINATTGSFSGLLTLNAGGNNTPASTPSTTALGYLGAPVNEQDGNYTLTMTDAGKMVRCNTGGATTYTIPPSGSVAYALGTTIVIRNIGAGSLTIQRGSGVILWKAGSGVSQDVVMSQYGMATMILESSNWVISGVGIV